MLKRKDPKKNHNLPYLNHLNVIIRVYMQKCKICKTEGETYLDERSVKKFKVLGSKEIFKFYDMEPEVEEQPPDPKRSGLKNSDHQPKLCLACKTASCAWYWSEIREKI